MSYDDLQPNLKTLSQEYAEATKRTVFFVGAGCGIEVGLPSWGELRRGLCARISSEVDSTRADEQMLEHFRELEELATSNDKFWEFFSHASRHWPVTYNDYLVDTFDNKINTVHTPRIYQRIWKMPRSRQVFTLNVDSLVSRAFHEVKADPKQNQLFEYDGFSIGDSLSFMARDSFCVINLHGTFYEKSRWIMDEEQRSRLTGGAQGEKYSAYLSRIFTEYNIVFIGLNPLDIAVSPFLAKAVDLGLIGKHFWICPDPSPDQERWAQQNRVRLIRYSPEINESGIPVHSQDICGILTHVEEYVSEERRVALPPSADAIDPSSLGSPFEVLENLAKDRLATSRRLSGAVEWIGGKHGYSSKELQHFLKEFNIPIQIASTVDDKMEGFNRVDRYKLVGNLQSTGISSVWTAKDVADEKAPYFALKLLNGSGLNDTTERDSFRRGIESLYLLSESDTSVAPKYYYHSEIPLSVVMEHIPGSTLRDFKGSFPTLSHSTVLTLFRKICSAVLVCHQTDAQVLHRDVKPGNILIEGWHLGYEEDEALNGNVRLINFDLSWHRFTTGNTKAISADDIGYYAPEQRYSLNTMPPRTAATDVYMLGMVLYFLVTGENPPDGGARIKDWHLTVHQKLMRVGDFLTRMRLTRLIVEMTELKPEERIDLKSIVAELEALSAWHEKNVLAIDDDLFVENLAVSTQREYEWRRSGYLARVRAREATYFDLQYQHRGGRAVFFFFRQRSDSDNRASFGERMRERISSCVQILNTHGWEARADSNKGINASIRIPELKKMPDFGATIWENIANQLLASFE